MFERTTQLRFSTEISTSPQALYDFHTDTNNLLKIMPPWIKVNIVSLKLPMTQGEEVTLDISRFGIRQRWKMRIAKLLSPKLVSDEAIESPFKSFVHHHSFEEIDKKRTKLCDELEFTLPFYPLNLIALALIKKDINKLFDYRHKKTKLILEKNNV